MKWTLLLVLAVGLTGCNKKTPTAENAAERATPAEAQAPANPEDAPAAPRAKGAAAPAAAALPAESQALVGAVHTFMTDQLRIFIQQKGRMPSTFAEFASARMDSVPRPPEGMKFAIDPTTVEVKLVPR